MIDFASQQIREIRKARPEHGEAPQEPSDMPPPMGEPAASPARKMKIEWFDDAADDALSGSDKPLIDGVLDEEAMSVVYGDSNTGKTFIALNMSFAVATGTQWNGHNVKHGLIVYIAAEGGARIKRRIAALKKRYLEDYGPNAPRPLFALIRFPIDLRSNDADLRQLIALVREAEKQTGEKCAWVIVDTLSRAMAGGDENSPVDMGRIVTAADRIRAETKAHFTYVHHTGKDAAKGARGHSLLRAATDTEIEVTPKAIEATKQRDMECGFTLGFSLVDFLIGIDASGQSIKSAIVEWLDRPKQKEDGGKCPPPRSQRLLFDCILEALDGNGEYFRPDGEGPLVKGVDDERVRRIYYARVAEKALPDEDESKLEARRQKAFSRSVKMALDARLLAASEIDHKRFLWLTN